MTRRRKKSWGDTYAAQVVNEANIRHLWQLLEGFLPFGFGL